MTSGLLVAATTFGASVIATRLVERYALQRRILDHPSERGLHHAATPRGGGAAILLAASIALLGLNASGAGGWFASPALIGIAAAYGALGWLDDHHSLAITPRLLAQLLFAAGFVAVCGDGLVNPLVSVTALPAWFLGGIVIVAVAGFVNVFNFMDGADGYAGGAALAALAGGAIVAHVTGDRELLLTTLTLGAAVAGFLVWNWHPARIFMGDVGSYFLGFEFCALTARDVIEGYGAYLWLILLAPFITDGVLTLARRIWRRERFWRAHRTHAYQVLILSGLSHATVSAGIVTLTLAVLAPTALLTRLQPAFALPLTAVVYGLNGMLWLAAQRRPGNVTTST